MIDDPYTERTILLKYWNIYRHDRYKSENNFVRSSK